MRVGVLGCGSIGSRHARNAKALGHDLFLFDDDDMRALGLGMEVAVPAWACSSFSAVATHSDAILVCTPASTHATVAKELLAIGYRGPLFCEKPLALSVEDCEVFRSWPHPTTMVGYQFRHNVEVIDIHERGRDADSFDLLCATDMAAWPGGAYGDPLLECSHEIDIALHWLGEGAQLQSAIPLYDDMGMTLTFTNSKQSVMTSMNWKEPAALRRYLTRKNGERTRYDDLRQEWIDNSYLRELAHFLACVEKQAPTITPFADGIRVVDVCEQALKLAKATA